MKLAEALIIRSDLHKRIEQLKSRIHNNLVVQEGTLPAEDPKELIRELAALEEELETVITRINKTNQATDFGDGKTLSDAITKRERLMDERNFLASVVREASTGQVRYSSSEIRMIPMLDAAKVQKEVDRLAKEYRELDMELQAKNWSTELQ